jgi:hypothetical protein
MSSSSKSYAKFGFSGESFGFVQDFTSWVEYLSEFLNVYPVLAFVQPPAVPMFNTFLCIFFQNG